MGPWGRPPKNVRGAGLPAFPTEPTDPGGGGEWFAVEVTEVTGTGASAVYSFTEIQTVPGVGGTEERTSARTCDKDVNPARSLDDSVTFAVGDKALARRAVSDVNAFELAPVGGGGEESFLVLLTEKSFAEDFIEYSAEEVEASGDLTYAVKSGGRTFSPGTTPLYHERNLNFAVVGVTEGDPNFVHPWSVVRVRQHPDGFWYFQDNPVHGICRRTGNASLEGEEAYHRINTSSTPGAPTWADDIELDLIEAE